MLPTYDQYKNTGYQWLPEIPGNWKMLRGKNLFEDVDVRSKTGEEELLTVSHITGVTPRKQKTNVTMFQAESLEGYKLCEPGDFVANTMWVWMGAIAVSKYEGLVSPAYNVYRQKKENYDPAYLNYLLRVHSLISEYKGRSTGVRSSRLRLYPEQLLRIGFPLPPLVEQEQIVRYLDRKISRIHRLISLKKREIALLKEQKQAIISNSVTKGLNPDAEMKGSGVEWIGEIPKGWTLIPLKYMVKHNQISLSENTNKDFPLKYIDISSVNSNGQILSVQKQIFATAPSRARRIVTKDDVIVSTVRTYLKAIAIITEQHDSHVVSTGFVVLTPLKRYVPKYLYYAISSNWFLSMVESRSVGVSYPEINTDVFISLPTLVPPHKIQKEIITYLDEKSSIIDSFITKEEQSIEYLQEYKTRLISDVVTGKIDVRNIPVADPLLEENLYPEEYEDKTEILEDEE